MKFLRLIVFILFCALLFQKSALCADEYKVKDLILDNSDRMVLILGEGNFRKSRPAIYIPSSNSSINLINDISKMTLPNPPRYVIDIPNAILLGTSRDIKVENSKVIQNIKLSQFSLNPGIVRAVITVKNQSDLTKFKTLTNGADILVQYSSSLIDNTKVYKFYTPSGDMDKTITNQNVSSITSFLTGESSISTVPKIQTKYYLSQVSQNQYGLLLKGLGSVTLQKALYFQDKVEVILDNATLSKNLENKTYNVPMPDTPDSAIIQISQTTPKKIKLTINTKTPKEFRFVISPDGQTLFVAHRLSVLNTVFSSDNASVYSYGVTSTDTGYKVFDMVFDKKVSYEVFELNNNFYLDILNMSDFDEQKFKQMYKNENIQAAKIATDKTRFTIPQDNLKFAYASIESNSKSIKLCFKTISDTLKKDNLLEPTVKQNQQTQEPPKKETQKEIKQDEAKNINVTYVPKDEDKKIKKPKKQKENLEIKSLRKVVLDPGHGGLDSGAIALGNKYYEKTINLNVALMVRDILQKKNISVLMTRDIDKTLSLEDRVNFSNEISPDIYVSIHANSTLQNDRYGLETYYYKEDSIKLAQTVHANFASEKNLKKWETKDRGVLKSRFYVINHTEAPSILIEMGFISNEIERDKLAQKERQEEIAKSIAQGILEYLKVK